MGDNSDKKKYRLPIFSWGIHIWNFKTLAYMVLKNYAMHMKATRSNTQKLQRAITNKISLNWLKIQSGNLLLSPNQYTKYQGSSSNTFWDILLTRFQCYFIKRAVALKWETIQIQKKKKKQKKKNEISVLFYYKGNNSKTGENADKKKIRFTYFVMRNPYMNVQNISMHSSKLMLCTWKQQIAKNCKGPSLQENFIKIVENLIRWSPPQSQSVYQFSRL